MNENIEEGSLGDIFKSAINLPIDVIKAPYNVYKSRYGKSGSKDTYSGSYIQKVRLKKILPIMYSGSSLSTNDRHFMDMVNRFMTEQGHEPIDQHNIPMTCNGCVPYIFKSIKHKKNNHTNKPKPKGYSDLLPTGIYNVRFDSELKPKEYQLHYFTKGSTYRLNIFKVYRDRGTTYIYARNRFLKPDDYLLFKTEIRNPINDPTIYKVYQNNSSSPLKTDIKLGRVIMKIF